MTQTQSRVQRADLTRRLNCKFWHYENQFLNAKSCCTCMINHNFSHTFWCLPNYADKLCIETMYLHVWICEKIPTHAITPLKLHGKSHSKYIKWRAHAKMVVNLQPQRDFCKDIVHYNKKPSLPCRFTTHFATFCPNTKNDTGLPFKYMMVPELFWLFWSNIPALLPSKTNHFVMFCWYDQIKC